MDVWDIIWNKLINLVWNVGILASKTSIITRLNFHCYFSNNMKFSLWTCTQLTWTWDALLILLSISCIHFVLYLFGFLQLVVILCCFLYFTIKSIIFYFSMLLCSTKEIFIFYLNTVSETMYDDVFFVCLVKFYNSSQTREMWQNICIRKLQDILYNL